METNGEYISDSTIDNPPRDQADDGDENDGQQQLPGIEQDMTRITAAPYERKFKVELKLSMTPLGEKAITVPVLCGEYPSSRVEEILSLALSTRRFKNILLAILDNPIPVPEMEALPAPTEVVADNHQGQIANGTVVDAADRF